MASRGRGRRGRPRGTIHKPDLSGRMAHWAMELSEYGIQYIPCPLIVHPCLKIECKPVLSIIVPATVSQFHSLVEIKHNK